MSYSEDYDWRCMNCGGFHECGNCPYYEDQSWKNQLRTCWEGYENPNSWNPLYYGEYDHQPFVQEEPHQRQGNGSKKSIEELFEEFMIRTNDYRKVLSDGCIQCGSPHCGERCSVTIAEEEAQIEAEVQKRLAQKLQEEAWIEAEVQKRLAQKLQEEAQIEAAVQERLAQRLQEGFMDRTEINCKDQEELQIEEIYVPQVLEEDEKVESPEEASEVVTELECEKMGVGQKEQMVECEELKEVPIVDFVFGDKLMIEKPLSISTYLMNLWSQGAQGKEQARGNIFGSTWNQIRENFLTPLVIHLINLAMIFEIGCSILIELGQNLHDLSGSKHFAIDPG